MKKTLFILSSCVLLAGCSEVESLVKKIPYFKEERKTIDKEADKNSEIENSEPLAHEGPVLEAAFFNQIAVNGGKKEIQNPNNILTLVNKEFSLSGNYKPADLIVPNVAFSFGDLELEKSLVRKEAAVALEKMFKEAKAVNIELIAVSGYRSYQRQKALFDAEVAKIGQVKAAQAVAIPGQSEHQTGLTMDISSRKVNLNLTEEFGETPEGKWLAQNAHKYGYILRYPKGKEAITKYQYEPWHFRYVGTEAAKTMYENDWTLEEFFQQVKKI